MRHQLSRNFKVRVELIKFLNILKYWLYIHTRAFHHLYKLSQYNELEGITPQTVGHIKFRVYSTTVPFICYIAFFTSCKIQNHHISNQRRYTVVAHRLF